MEGKRTKRPNHFFEKFQNLYLQVAHGRITFVIIIPELKKQALKEALFFTLALALTLTGLSAQETDSVTVWPGDVNNNGVVNTVDVLYWSVADGERGEKRPNGDTVWDAERTVAWGDTLPGGLDLAYADCDGNGVINEADLRIIRRNFNLTRPGNMPDIFTPGVPGQDPLLSLNSEQEAVRPSETLLSQVQLGDQSIPATDFFGITFTNPYKPEEAGKDTSEVTFELEKESWIGKANSEVKEFVYKDEAGKTHVAIYRKNNADEVTEGSGPIGVFSIIIAEDIVVGIPTADLGLEEIKLVSKSLGEMPVAIKTLSVTIDRTTSTQNSEANRHLAVYPNPVNERLFVEWTASSGQLERIEMFNMLGQNVLRQTVEGQRQARVDTSRLPAGTYVLRIYTSQGMVARTISR